MILAGDIGGTKTHLGLFRLEGGGLALAAERRFPSGGHPSLLSIVREFVPAATPVESACFGVAGPVQDGHVHATNLPWLVDAGEISHALGRAPVALLNDIEALAVGLETLGPADLETLHRAPERPGHRALIAAGTGLGQGMLIWTGHGYHPVASEGGHSDLAPRNALEIELLEYLAREFGHVSWERVLSGPGLVNVYRFLRDSGRGQEPAELAERLREQDPAAVISKEALAGTSRLCQDALDLFIALYGAEAGNLALEVLALGGVYVGGGIAPKILPRLRAGGFMKAFRDKGRMGALLEKIPVHVVLKPDAALHGAALHAARQAAQERA